MLVDLTITGRTGYRGGLLGHELFRHYCFSMVWSVFWMVSESSYESLKESQSLRDRFQLTDAAWCP